MKYISYLIVGIIFGITLTKAEVISWFRIQEMFRFQAFHMYGVIGTAVGLGALSVWLMKKFNFTTIAGGPLSLNPKAMSISRYLLGGILFGLGWAMTGACPGPLYILVGNGMTVFILSIISALAGTFVYGLLRDKLPH